MARCEDQRSALAHSGTSQLGRELASLRPDHVGLDERKHSDWIVFAAELAKFLKFYDAATGASSKAWQAFFASDICAVLSALAVQNVEVYRQALRGRLDVLRAPTNSGTPSDDDRKTSFGQVVSAVLTLAAALDDYFRRLPSELPLRASMGAAIRTKLAPAFRRLVGYGKGAKQRGLYSFQPVENVLVFGRAITDAEQLWAAEGAFGPEWWTPGTEDADDVAADEGVFGTGSTAAALTHAANHFLFHSAIDQFTEVFARLVLDAERALQVKLESDDDHAPHYGLFLGFLKLFREAQQRLNEIPERHLTYYYEDVLRLKRKPLVPSQVYLIAQLAKHVESAQLAAGTLFKAGKDEAGRELLYALDGDTTFNHAQVVELKSIYRVDPNDDWERSSLAASRRIFASPVSNSRDGLGAELRSPLGSWHPFVNATRNRTSQITAIDMPPARIGFAVAAAELVLGEGARVVSVKIVGTLFGDFDNSLLRCQLTAEKGWIERPVSTVSADELGDGTACTLLRVNIESTAPAIVSYDAAVHGGRFNTDLPIAAFVLRNDATLSTYGYAALANVTVQRIQVSVNVGDNANPLSGLRQLQLSNATGIVDGAKPFQGWGPQPQVDAALVIGSRELFIKRNVHTKVFLYWSAPAPSRLDAEVELLEGGAWRHAPAIITSYANPSSVALNPDSLSDRHAVSAPFGLASRSGFLRLRLSKDFGQASYTAALAAAIAAAKAASTPEAINAAAKTLSELKAPVAPVIADISMVYDATSPALELHGSTSSADVTEVQFFHLSPFGELEIEPGSSGAPAPSLLPQLRSGATDHVGEWFIGIAQLRPQQSVALLVQALEGSALPLVSKPAEHVRWSYWSNDRWADFESRAVSDETDQLVQSGIIRFALPDDATTDGGALTPGLIWLRASITAAAGAICAILSVTAQALSASLVVNEASGAGLEKPLAPGTITKLKQPLAAFKAFTQPYPSHGGRPLELARSFQLRVSERLRHKARAVTLWDYERLVLEAFPQLHRVKCLNQTQVVDDANSATAIYNENQPGCVAIVAVPKLANRNDADPLKPYLSRALIKQIEAFLSDRISGQLTRSPRGHARLNVCNPFFEEVTLEFSLQLAAGYADFSFYQTLLAQELTTFLSPWAFDATADVQFGGRIAKSVLVNFIEERTYVDFISDVVMRHRPASKAQTGDLEEAVASTARSILVSAPASSHSISRYST